MTPAEAGGPDDDMCLDEEFVAGARYHEASAAERLYGGSVVVLPPPRSPRERRRRGARRVLALLLAAAALAGAVRVLHAWVPSWTGRAARGAPVGTLAAAPPLPAEPRTTRLLPAPAVPAGAAVYAFLRVTAAGLPVTWSPCEAVHVVVREAGQPPDGPAVLSDALARLGSALGMQLVVDGTTDEAPGDGRAAYQPERYGATWAPVLVAWSDPTETPALAGPVAGVAGPVSWSRAGAPPRWVSGQVVLDGPQLAALAGSEAGLPAVTDVVLHELGHLAGLGHVPDPRQLMSSATSTDGPTGYGDGDLHGLALLGRGPCGAP